ncbi:MAG: phage tail protein [Planctomycetaceae bacterium]|nr:phage tail protein [Planctomycetaceae bacterium]
MDIQIKLDEQRLREVQLMLREIPRGMATVMSRGINKTAVSVRAEVVRKIAAEVNLSQKRIREALTISQANWTKWAATINISRKRIGLINFGARQTARGVSYKIDKAHGRKAIEHAFIATAKGAENVWVRETDADGTLVPRLPIVRLQGPSIGEVFKRAAWLVQQTYASAETQLNKNIETQIELMLDKFRKAKAA